SESCHSQVRGSTSAVQIWRRSVSQLQLRLLATVFSKASWPATRLWLFLVSVHSDVCSNWFCGRRWFIQADRALERTTWSGELQKRKKSSMAATTSSRMSDTLT